MKTIQSNQSGSVLTLTIDIEDKPMNVLTPDFLADLTAAIESAKSDNSISGVIITSGKETFFAGADLKALSALAAPDVDAEELLERAGEYQRILRALETMGKPVAAAINGTALGGGLELALACHYRICVDNPKALLGCPEVQVGLLPGAGGTQRLPRLIGIEPALPLLLQGKHLSPQKAQAAGFINEVVPADELLNAAARWLASDSADAEQPWDKKGFKVPGGAGLMHPRAIQTLMVGSALTQKETNLNYPAPHAIMSAVYEGTVLPIDKALQIESKYFVSLLRDPVAHSMIRSLFVNKQAADKLVRRPEGVDKTRVEKLGILGAGMMGAGIAYVSARAGMQVVLLDRDVESAEKGKDYSRNIGQKGINRKKTTSEKVEALLEKIKTTDNYADLEGCDLVIEAVFEDREIKAKVTAATEAVIPTASIFASNTSTLPITGLAEASSRPEQFIGIHFFSPVDKMPLVEIILGKESGDKALAVALDYVQQIHKTPIVVNDSRGFYTSRVFGVFTREGMHLLTEGVKPALIENVAKQAGMPVGPLAVTDEVSLELGHHVYKQTKVDLGSDYKATAADDVLIKMVETLDRRGKRFGKGFYDYADDGSKRLWPGLSVAFPVSDVQPHRDEVEKRLLYAQAIDSARCLEEGVLIAPEDGDIGSIFGWGFPPYTGGTFSYIEAIGVVEFVAEADRLAKEYGERFNVPDLLRSMAASGESFYGPGRRQRNVA